MFYLCSSAFHPPDILNADTLHLVAATRLDKNPIAVASDKRGDIADAATKKLVVVAAKYVTAVADVVRSVLVYNSHNVVFSIAYAARLATMILKYFETDFDAKDLQYCC